MILFNSKKDQMKDGKNQMILIRKMAMIVIRMVVMTGKRPNAVGSVARMGALGACGRMTKRKVMAALPGFAN